MQRCASALLAAAVLVAAPLAAQAQRLFPQKALRGEITFTAPPEILLNGQTSRLAPGVRLRDERNMGAFTEALAGQKFTVHYTVDQMGQPLEVWILTRAEIANRPWPRTAEEALAWLFNYSEQTWTQP